MIRLLLVLAIMCFTLPAFAGNNSTMLDDPNALVALIMGHKWIALTAVVIGLIVRLLKSDTKIPIDIPPRLRAPLALTLGAASGAIDKLVQAGDTTWTAAITSGVVAAVVAMIGHVTLIDSLRGGKEIVVPGLINENTPPGPGKPPSIPPSAMNEKTMKDAAAGKDVDTSGLVRSIFAPLIIAATFFLAACHLLSPSELPNTVLNIKDITCIIEHAFVDDKTLNTLCNLLTAEQQSAAREVAKAHRDSVKRQLATMKSEACDGGAVDGGASK